MHIPSHRLLRAALALFAAHVPATVVAQTTVTLSPAADGTLYEHPTGGLSNSSGDGLFIGRTAAGGVRRAVLRFDVGAALPAGAKVLAATLSLNVVRTLATSPQQATLHRVTQSWSEGPSAVLGSGGGGTTALPGDVTWLHRVYPNTMWTTPGGDFVAAPFGSLSLPTFGSGSTAVDAGFTATVQGWLDAPAQNFGLLLKTDELQAGIAYRIDSRESLGTRPQLAVTYVAPAQNATWGTGCTVGAGPYVLAYTGAPIGGTTIQLAQTNGPAGAAGFNLFSLGLDPVGSLLPPGCRIHLPLGLPIVTGGLFVGNAAGVATTPIPVPVGFPGVLLVAQAAALSPGPAGYTLSNAAIACLQ
jgi:hypothetical protein